MNYDNLSDHHHCIMSASPPCSGKARVNYDDLSDHHHCIMSASPHCSGKARVNYDDLSDVEVRELNQLAKLYLQVCVGGCGCAGLHVCMCNRMGHHTCHSSLPACRSHALACKHAPPPPAFQV